MDFLVDFFDLLLDSDRIVRNGGLYLVLLLLFIETGVILGFFLPGDPLLFISGMIIAAANETHYPFTQPLLNLFFWMLLFIISTILGYFFAYWTGYKFKYLFDRERDTWFLKQKHVAKARRFYDKRGGLAVMIARFIPAIGTLSPIIVGSVGMNLKKFTIYNVIGAFLWVGILVPLGYVLGDNPWVQQNLGYLLLGILILLLSPVIFNALFGKKQSATD